VIVSVSVEMPVMRPISALDLVGWTEAARW